MEMEKEKEKKREKITATAELVDFVLCNFVILIVFLLAPARRLPLIGSKTKCKFMN